MNHFFKNNDIDMKEINLFPQQTLLPAKLFLGCTNSLSVVRKKKYNIYTSDMIYQKEANWIFFPRDKLPGRHRGII